jgi:hypothetical protein
LALPASCEKAQPDDEKQDMKYENLDEQSRHSMIDQIGEEPGFAPGPASFSQASIFAL